ncbi:hypothetical protein PIB30_036426 [Stylosanthes scabra]|uniref:Uncharacterized protein n=1 Tax=Stylosanthes scabra TaxID=79078 RepID=A0ABU6TEG2_9FABA|nr:hypothetical protein [Stylosanthes scabra]
MAAKLEGGAYLSSFVEAISKKLSSIRENDSVLDSTLKLLQRLDNCLCDVEPVLDDAELKQFRNERVKTWLVDLQDVLYMADDLADELSTKAATAAPRDPGNSYDWSRPVDSIIDDSGVNVMEKIVRILESLVARKNKLDLDKSAKVDFSSWRIPSTSLVVSSDIFGRNNDKKNIIKLLLDNTYAAESPVTVIPIVGMGGIGKTTLAQLIYNDAQVMGKFDTRAWVCVAENPDPIHVTKTIIGALDSSPCNLDHFDSLQTHLKEKLSRKTFLVVFDDVWNDEQYMWDEFLKPFRYGNNGSKILLTTRSAKVASVFAANNLHYRLSLLSEENCWSIFLKHSSLSTESKEYATLEPIGRKIVEKCKGLPLAVKTLAGLLRNKYDEGDWENILESEIWKLREDESKIIPALRVSYHYLPSHLKRCFVYCSLFSEDFRFDKDKLILLWMAEDLLQPQENNTLENIGCAYFDELVARSFFQPSSYNGKYFVMHDLMHDLAVFFAGKFYFKFKEFGNPRLIDNKTRHLSCGKFYEDSIKLFREAYNGAAHMRTFLDYTYTLSDRSIDIESDFLLLQQQLECLRVFSSRLFKKLPDSIGELIHLRYLNLSDSPIVTLPESICKLYNLQTLKLKDCRRLKMLPNGLQDLVNLRHLDIRGAFDLKKMPKGMRKLNHLNFLPYYIVGEQEDNGIRELGTLDDLHGSFRISNLENVKHSGEALEARMGNKKHINTLELQWCRDGDIDDVETERDILDKLQPHQKLKTLSIWGYGGETFPDWLLGLSCYSNMTKLSLMSCKNCGELPSLAQLPSLQHLEISYFAVLEKIDLEFFNKNSSGSFQQEAPFKSLETLIIRGMSRWREWHFPDDFDGFPRLRILSIEDCPVLRGDLPAHLPALEDLTINRCEKLACSVPSAPKLCELHVNSTRSTFDSKFRVVMEETQLALPFWECLSLIELPRVQYVKISKCKSAISISGDYLPASLQYLEMEWCPEITISGQLHHKWLTEIKVATWGSVTFPLGDLPNLKKLELSYCENMEYVEVPDALPSLLYLDISCCPRLVSLPALGRVAPRLEELRLFHCPEVVCFAEECLPSSLIKLDIFGCDKLASRIASKGLQSEGLTHLVLRYCNDVKSFPGEGCLPASLEYLQLLGLGDLETLDCKGLHHLTSLKTVSIKYCDKLENIIDKHLLSSIVNIYIWFMNRATCYTNESMEKSIAEFASAAKKANNQGFISIDCGLPGNSSYTEKNTGINYISDANFIDSGVTKTVSPQDRATHKQQFNYLRSFPNGVRNCYKINVTNGADYLIRASFLYGNYDGLNKLPQFEVHLGPNVWEKVKFKNSSISANYEIIHSPSEDHIHLCLANTGTGTPFISVIELRSLPNDTYIINIQSAGSLARVLRHDLGSITNLTYRYKDDTYDRIWKPYWNKEWTQLSTSSVNINNLNNSVTIPPAIVMSSAATPINSSASLDIKWDADAVTDNFYFYLHFNEIQELKANETRSINIILNGKRIYGPFTPEYRYTTTVYTDPPYNGFKTHRLSILRSDLSTLPPIINAIEIYVVKDLSKLETQKDDVDAITNIKVAYKVTRNWVGDPCGPETYKWDGVDCSSDGVGTPRITFLNLSSGGLIGHIVGDIFKLTMLKTLDLSHNNLTGDVPYFLTQLQSLQNLNLANNNLSGSIPIELLQKQRDGRLSLRYA